MGQKEEREKEGNAKGKQTGEKWKGKGNRKRGEGNGLPHGAVIPQT